ncbi:MAG: 50S ribosomal protein L23 [Janthinobacterium lividum]|uniref:Large ribosomal subunit protein uL23 n=4 Tax=Rickettsia bellii TaxID=33990 RepID=RL23_RICBR|nr:50S ribosomal protein L23 [Rickettsia bellii]A8GVB6.1 RecName: Full=Large ribosomal subunit protein uL23; AltName: Full=50S ribosomal protein L23 [Rickettsia bellii OSU 85-389]Q1RHM3.1 RecName: Full=Large ribosomal subunit protein uL23; AltName: Full=50S ribosomal protein L23 [Rickettsia bellii RML369-C]MCC8370624.1 50S ribosomal protein L23 [Rickettsia endosymbiont of Stiretrus anchorago]HJD65577.1 50S ribosomal protein L23 [Rickettsia endosymbiont of Bembidion nr. Transversale]HJD67364.1 
MSSYKYYDLIRRPVITEKTTLLSEQNKYTFYVDKLAEKLAVKKAIEEIFKVKVKKVNILNVKGKKKRFKGVIGRQVDRKKAVVTLEKDHNIDFAGGIK